MTFLPVLIYSIHRLRKQKMIKLINDNFDTVILPILFVLGAVVVALDLFYWRAV